MKKALSLTSLALFGVVALTGCSCGSKGTYVFSHIEYEKDGEKKETTCEDPTASELGMCALAASYKVIEITLEKNKFITKSGNISEEMYYKFEDGALMYHQKEDAEKYIDSGLKYKFMGKLVNEVDLNNDGEIDFTIVLKKK